MKVGDKVRVIKDCGYTGREAKIIDVRWGLFTLDIDGGFWLWSKNELELIEEPRPKLKVGDWVKVKSWDECKDHAWFLYGMKKYCERYYKTGEIVANDYILDATKPYAFDIIDLEILPQVGDEVVILKGQKTRGIHFVSEMLEFVGKKAIITTLKTGCGYEQLLYKLDVDNESWYWIPEWLSLTDKKEVEPEEGKSGSPLKPSPLSHNLEEITMSLKKQLAVEVSRCYLMAKDEIKKNTWGDYQIWLMGGKIENIARKIEYKDENNIEEEKEALDNNIDALIKDFEVNNNAKLISYEKPKFEIKYEI